MTQTHLVLHGVKRGIVLLTQGVQGDVLNLVHGFPGLLKL